jgi:HAD superfamily hydrolase (TIGR01509 family)
MRDVDLKEGAARAAAPDVDLVIFDCDGVLVDSEMLSMRAYREALLATGIDIAQDDLLDCVGLKQADILGRIEKISGSRVPQGVRDSLWPRIHTLFQAELKPTARLLEFLSGLETKRCVASSSDPARLQASLALTGLASYFGDAVFSTQYVPRGKPAPDIYLFAAERMGADPAHTVVVEDSAPGVQGAIAAGMTAIGFVGGAHIRPGHADLLTAAGAQATFSDWPSVSAWLAGKAASY